MVLLENAPAGHCAPARGLLCEIVYRTTVWFGATGGGDGAVGGGRALALGFEGEE
jgi:hypothetical protein